MRIRGWWPIVALAIAAVWLAVVQERRGADESGLDAASRAVASTAPSSTATAPPAPVSVTTVPPTTIGAASAGCDRAAALAALPIRDRLAQLVMVGIDPRDPNGVRDMVVGQRPGGVFVGGNDTTVLTSGVLTELQASLPLGLLVAVDDEGGRVQRIDAIAGPTPSAQRQAATLTPAETRALGRRLGDALVAHGVNVNFAPVLDLGGGAAGAAVGDRAYSADPELVTAYAGAFAAGLTEAGVVAVYKHFPGHGGANGDSHDGLPVTPPLAELGPDLLPYRSLLPGAHGVMLGHLDVPGLTEGLPASLSPPAIDLLRGELGFSGVVFTDDLAAMRGVTDRFSPIQAGIVAIGAGADVLLYSALDVTAFVTEADAAIGRGELTRRAVDESVGRILEAKGIDPCDLAA